MNAGLTDPRSGFTLTDGLIVLALAALVGLAAWPRVRVRSILEREDAIARDLEDLAARIEGARAAAAVDDDGDGRARFPVLDANVLGTRAVQFEPSGDLSAYARHGYWFAMLLPDRRRLPVGASSPEVAAEYADETFWLLAWPIEPGTSGIRAYLFTPLDGVLRHTVDGYPYQGPDRPPAPAAEMLVLKSGRPVPVSRKSETWRPPR